MKKFQRSIAAIAAVATAISAMSIASFAEGDSSVTASAVEGEGSFEGTVDSIRYQMVLPTVAADTDMYDFILDPQNLIKQTGADRFGEEYDEGDFTGDGYLYFKNTAAGSTTSTTVYVNNGSEAVTYGATTVEAGTIDNATYEALDEAVKSNYEAVAYYYGSEYITASEYNALETDDKLNYSEYTGDPMWKTAGYTTGGTTVAAGDSISAEVWGTLDGSDKAKFTENTTETEVAGEVTYSNESDVLTAYNLSNQAVKLTVEGAVTGADDLTFVSTTPTEGLNIQLGITDGDENTVYFATADGATTAKFEANLAAMNPKAFEIVWNEEAGESGAYTYGFVSDVQTELEEVGTDYSAFDVTITETQIKIPAASFNLIGAIANDNDGDKWEEYKGTPKVSVVWSMKDPNAVPEVVDEAPNVNGQTAVALTNNKTGHTVTIDLGEGDLKATGLAETDAVLYAIGTSTTFKTLNSNYTFDATTGEFTLNSTAAGLLTDGSRIKINLNDGTTITLTFADA